MLPIVHVLDEWASVQCAESDGGVDHPRLQQVPNRAGKLEVRRLGAARSRRLALLLVKTKRQERSCQFSYHLSHQRAVAGTDADILDVFLSYPRKGPILMWAGCATASRVSLGTAARQAREPRYCL